MAERFASVSEDELCEKCIIMVINTTASIWRKISLDICPWTLSVPQRSQFFSSYGSRKTVRFSEQMISVEKYPSIFSRHMEAITYIYTQVCYIFQPRVEMLTHVKYALYSPNIN